MLMMTRPVRDRILKDSNGDTDITYHLRNHIHLTNCIHLKNHMHKHSPILGDRSLMRDLVVLQRSRSLRDPSASPPSWHSPSVVDTLPTKGEMEAVAREGRRSIERSRRESRRLSGGSLNLAGTGMSRVAPNEEVGALSDHSSKRRVRREEESSRRSSRAEFEPPRDESLNGGRHKGKHIHIHDTQIRTLSEQLKDIPGESDDVVSSNIHLRPGRHSRGGVNRRKYRGARKTRARDVGGLGQNEMSVASNSFAQGSGNITGGAAPRNGVASNSFAQGSGNITGGAAPRNGCGIPWNWSRIHHRGKTFLDIAGRSLSCGLSEPRRGGSGNNIPDMPLASDDSSSPSRYEREAMPLLVEASGSQASSEHRGWVHDYSGELGIFADNLLKHDVDSDLASEARSGGQHKSRRQKQPCGRHQNLTQKYTPRTFRDLVGQNLVAQGLSNAVTKRKVGLLYVFYGPHGTGKTSCARIFARALNCQSSEHPKPCGFCNSCIAHDSGKSQNVMEVGPVSNFDFETMVDLLENMKVSPLPSQYRVFIFDDCDTLPSDCWSAITKVIDHAPRRVVFVLLSSGLDILPHIILSRCQKFFFPKLKDADIIYTLQWIATKEDLEIDKDALKLIASRSDGSLRDAEMTLEQLSLLGQRISVPLVQELVGLISDEKLVDLLDLALSADTVNTVKNLRVIMETSVEPLALMSQLATVITDILAGSYDFTRERHRRKFFRRQPLSKEDMERLRQALKTLSEAEKQLRVSNDKSTWLTAALLQLAPDQQYMMPTSADTSFNQSPLALNKEHGEIARNGRDLSGNFRTENLPRSSVDRKRQAGSGTSLQKRLISGKSQVETEDLWLEVLGRIQINSIKHFLYQEGKLVSVSFGAAPTAHLIFSSHQAKSKAEKFKDHILQAFERVLGSPVTIEIRCVEGTGKPLILPGSKPGSPQTNSHLRIVPVGNGSNEIVEVESSPREHRNNGHVDGGLGSSSDGRSLGTAWVRQVAASQKNESLSIVRSKVSLAHVIQQAEGCAQQSGWSKRKTVSIAEKLEEENMRLEPRSRSLLCWKTSRVARRKLSRLKIRARRPRSLLKLISCGKCLSSKSPRR